MAKIIEFKKKVVSSAERYKALAKGNVRVFTCDTCGEDFEVIGEDYPEKCPHCGLTISKWKKIEENI